MNEKELLEIAVKDLVKLATKANNVIISGNFPGSIADEVNEVLQICKHVHNTFVKESEDES